MNEDVNRYKNEKYNYYSMVMDEEELKEIKKLIKNKKNKGCLRSS